MPNRPLKLEVRLPPYKHPRNEWRRQINRAVQERLRGRAVEYLDTDSLEVRAQLYLGANRSMIDIDNRLKDILDALQGRFGGPKKHQYPRRVIENDSQVCRATIEKRAAPKQARTSGGRLVITRYRP